MKKELKCPICNLRLVDVNIKFNANAKVQTGQEEGDISRKCDRCKKIIDVSLSPKTEYG